MDATNTPLPVGPDKPTQTNLPPSKVPETPAQTNTPEAIFRSSLKDLGAAPELENEVWLNTETPLRLADLRGKVVLLDMWTFG